MGIWLKLGRFSMEYRLNLRKSRKSSERHFRKAKKIYATVNREMIDWNNVKSGSKQIPAHNRVNSRRRWFSPPRPSPPRNGNSHPDAGLAGICHHRSTLHLILCEDYRNSIDRPSKLYRLRIEAVFAGICHNQY